jgi:ribosomal-protein-alanine N-acetyltransferase
MSSRLLSTPRLRLRPVAASDAAALHSLWMHPDVRRFLWDDAIFPRAETAAIVARSEAMFTGDGHGLWVATAAPGEPAFPDAEALLGFCGYWSFHDPPQLELLYGLAREAWGQGLATEMAHAMLAYGFAELDLPFVQASTDRGNRASVRVMERLGMHFHRRALSGPNETVFYRLRREEMRPLTGR